MLEQLMAGVEVAGRHLVHGVPRLRPYATKWVRRAGKDDSPVPLADFRQAMLDAGVDRGRDLMVHSSWAGFQRLQAKPSELLAVLRELVGDRATLTMPTGPVEKRKDGQLVYDAERSVSRMGLLSEALRRHPGALRSPVPLAPVSAVGPAAAAYTRDYREESSLTPWGRGSPYWEIAHREGQVLVLGIDFVRTLTLMHTAFDVLLGDNPIPDFYEPVSWWVTHGGREESWALRQQRRDLDKFLATYAFRRLALKSGTVREQMWRGIRIGVVDAAKFLRWHLPLARKSGLPYWGFARRA